MLGAGDVDTLGTLTTARAPEGRDVYSSKRTPKVLAPFRSVARERLLKQVKFSQFAELGTTKGLLGQNVLLPTGIATNNISVAPPN